jgi:LmbE family N-acetylglucosaminyl deacetylase
LRRELFDEIHISPHMDDSAYSCGGRILQRRREGAHVLVVTVFGNGKSERDASDTGTFSNYEARLAEELAVMRHLDADYIWLNYPELLFRKHGIGDLLRFVFPFTRLASDAHDDLFESLLVLLTRHLTPGGTVFFPFGVGFHPDHRVLFDVGRALHGLGRFQIAFYEDVPYNAVPALCAMRRQSLGMAASLPLLRSTRELNAFIFRNSKLRYFAWLPIFLHLAVVTVLRVLTHAIDKLKGEPNPNATALDIHETIEAKADAMRLYPSQTAFFMTLGPELSQMIKLEGRAQEISWTFPPFPSQDARLSPRQKAAAKVG